LQEVPCDVIVVYHHDFEPFAHEPLECGQFLLLQLVILNRFERDTAVTTFGDPGVKDFFVCQALDRADRKLKKLSGLAGAAASGGGVRGHACLHLKTSI
jgi:hypothetical protein